VLFTIWFAETNRRFHSLFWIAPFGYLFITSEMLYELLAAVTIHFFSFVF